MRTLARSLHWVARWIGSRPRAALITLAVTAVALAVGVAYSQQDPERVAPRPAAATAAAAAAADGPRRGGPAYYRRTTRKYVPPKGARAFLPLYREAEEQYAVSWYLIASIHRQETAFSTAKTTYHGLNDFGCCAGPMQFNVTNGPVSTWKRYRDAFRDGRRPRHYPHRTRKHPSIYDDFDAIMAAGSLLTSLGAGPDLDERAWAAAYGYYGRDLYGITYASTVLARAVSWQRRGFCPNCEPDAGLVAKFDRAYGRAARIELKGTDGEDKHKKKRKKKKKKKRKKEKRGDRKRDRDKREEREGDRPARRRQSTLQKERSPSPPRDRDERTQPAAPTPPETTPAAPSPAAPPPPECPPIATLLGCKP